MNAQPLRIGILGAAAFLIILSGGVLSGIGAGTAVYVVGYLFVIGFDKMFSIYLRTLRQRIIPPRDFGKTTGLIVMLNNLSQPLAGLIVALFSATFGLEPVILAITAAMGIVGAIGYAMRRRRIRG